MEPLDDYIVFAVERLGFSREQVLKRFIEIYHQFNALYHAYEELYVEKDFLEKKCERLEELLELEQASKLIQTEHEDY